MIYNNEELKNICLTLPKDAFVTSDTWFGREFINDVAKRPFKDINEMNTILIKNWNKVVKKNDVVFHLGNFAWDPITAENVLSKLNGTIYFFLGNEDDALIEVCEKFSNVKVLDVGYAKIPKYDVVLCHYPMLDWVGKETGTVHFHGHNIYNNTTQLVQGCNVVNVCTDFWDYKPVKISSIYSIINTIQKN